MPDVPVLAPALPYAPDLERPAPDEAEAGRAIRRSLAYVQRTTLQDYGHPTRGVHAKSHGLLAGSVQVLDGLPPALAQGLFARPGTYRAVLRFSTNPGDILDDSISVPRGLALKLFGVPGERLEDAEPAATQDFVMVNGPAFPAPTAAKFAKSLTLLARTTDTGQAWKKALSAALRGAVRLAQALHVPADALKSMGGAPQTHVLGETFFSQTPFRYGDHVAKFAVVPVSSNLVALKGRPLPLPGAPNSLRRAVIDAFAEAEGVWELRVQLRTNGATMPIEDATVVWPESDSPYVAVARLTVPRQPAWNEARARQVDDGLAFSPWNALVAHRPLGGINRVRRQAYDMSAGFRRQAAGCPMHGPAEAPELGGGRSALFGTTPGREGRRPGTPDARPGHWGAPLSPAARDVTAGALGGLAAGAMVSALMIGLQAATHEPSELVQLKRRAGRALGRRERRDGAPSTVRDELAAHGGHLALSAALGALYGAAKPASVRPELAGAGFGAGLWALAYGAAGPATGLTPKPLEAPAGFHAQHAGLHLLFGVATALVAERVKARL